MTQEGLPRRLLRASVYGLSASAGVISMAQWQVAAAAAVGAFAGALLGCGEWAQRWRRSSLWLTAVAAVLLALALGRLWVTLDGPAALFGPARAYRVSQVFVAAGTSLALATALRATARAVRAMLVVEVGLLALSGAHLVVAHRGGAINRPFELADAILAEGGDPTFAFLVLGAVLVLLSLVLLLSERRALRGLWHLVFVAVFFALLSDQLRVPEPPPSPVLEAEKQGGEKKQEGQGQSGSQEQNSEELQFRDNYDSEGRTVPLAVVLLHTDYSPPLGMYYFRQAAFSQYNGKRLVQTALGGVDVDVASGFPSEPVRLPEVPNGMLDRVAVETTVAMMSEHVRPFALATLQALSPLQNPNPGRFRRVYRATSMSLVAEPSELLGRPVIDPAWNEQVRAQYLATDDDPRYESLAQEIVDILPDELREDPVARALAVTLWLGREGTYSLKSGHGAAEDPTADFLFGDRVGYCVHFAHAAVYLMRTLGIPARVGAGYVVDEAARQGGSAILITGQNAHAWPEFYVQDVGWVVADVSPQQALDPPPSMPDPDLQRLLGELARGLSPLPTQGDSDLQPAVRTALELIAGLRVVLLWALPVALLLLYLAKFYRRLSPYVVGDKHAARAHYRAQLDRLSEIALVREFGESREAFAARLSAALPSFAATTALVEGARFGQGRSADRAIVRALSRDFGHELRGCVSPARRLRSLLDPFSFLRVR